uniref:Sushi domain-containing protein n=1 Tax=Neovison vison TaxID=452646 RepID=A0A8C7AX52_NEOVI
MSRCCWKAPYYCKAPEEFPFAKPTVLTDESEFPVGTSLNYECSPGYFEATFSITCLEHLVWSSAEGICRRKSCGAPPEPFNGAVHINTDTQFGSTVHYSCNEGYRLIGSPSWACLLLGSTVTWDKEAPVCEGELTWPSSHNTFCSIQICPMLQKGNLVHLAESSLSDIRKLESWAA